MKKGRERSFEKARRKEGNKQWKRRRRTKKVSEEAFNFFRLVFIPSSHYIQTTVGCSTLLSEINPLLSDSLPGQHLQSRELSHQLKICKCSMVNINFDIIKTTGSCLLIDEQNRTNR